MPKIKRIFNWQVNLGLFLVILSCVVYVIHYLIFRDAHHIFIYLIGDIAFVFFEVLLVTLIIHRLLSEKEKQSMLNKLNMVIGAFFSEVGTDLIKIFSGFDGNIDKIKKELVLKKESSDENFAKICGDFKGYESILEPKKEDLAALRSFLLEKRNFLLRLLENPNLLEHKSFTNLLWAVFHLTEELAHRKEIMQLPETDLQHLTLDIKRAYRILVLEWLSYMKHLQNNYPYLFSLAMRTNPFDMTATVEVR